jgi:tripartite-type tricarboxylate transporter receptor subunit TctC
VRVEAAFHEKRHETKKANGEHMKGGKKMLATLKKVVVSGLVVGLVLAGFSGSSYAAFPEKAITIIVGYRAGGSTDVVARTFAPFFSKKLGAPVVVKNMPGAGAAIAMRHVYKESPDGYTLVILTLPSYVTYFLLKKPTGYDLKEFTQLHGIGGGDSNGVMVPYDSRFKTFKDILEASKKEPITVSATTPGSNSWLLGLFLQERAGFKHKYVTFDSGRDATLAVVGGHVSAGIASTINFPDLVREKKVRVLGVGSTERLPSLPDVATFAELGYPGVKLVTRQLVMAPPKLPDDRKKILADAAAKAVGDPQFLAVAKKTGFSVGPLTPDECRKELLQDFENVAEMLKAAGIK